EAAAEALGRLGSAAATPEVLARLTDLLHDQEGDVRRAAAVAGGGLVGQGGGVLESRRAAGEGRCAGRGGGGVGAGAAGGGGGWGGLRPGGRSWPAWPTSSAVGFP